MNRVRNARLRLTHLNLLAPDIVIARREAKRRGVGYQSIIRGWVSDGAARAARTEEKRG